MDPITAIGFAASIITFVDFASELVSGASELYKSPTGQSAKNVHIKNVISDLQDVTDDLNTDSLGNSKEARRLRRLASNCNTLSEELLSILQGLRLDGNQNRPWKSLVVMWRNMRKADEVNSIEERLREYRSEMMIELSLMISNQQSSVCASLEAMKAEAVQLRSQTGRDLDSIKDQILQILANTEHIEESPNFDSERHTDIPQLLQQLQQLNSAIPIQHRILRHLMYSSMHFREESIHDAETGTCKWILEGTNEISDPEQIVNSADDLREKEKTGFIANELAHDSLTESDTNNRRNFEQLYERSQDLQKVAGTQFRKWLRCGKGIFHICGKPGSGKSTLMKYIRSNPQTRHELKKWAGCKELVIAYFYFSNNTKDESQMSLDSLYRSILFECLSQCPELIPEVFPQQWRNFHAVNGDSLLESNEFTKSKILNAFNILISKSLNPQYRLCFFFDGLDEYHGDTYDHWKLAEMLRNWSSGDDLKICASSRPHTEYLDTFCPPYTIRILLQDLNTYDIYVFSRKLLEKDERFPRIQEIYLGLAIRLSERSEGVFLWAVFAVRMLVTSLGYDDDPQDLEKNLDIIPEQLDMLYEKLLASVSKHNRDQCDKFLCLTLMNPFNVPLSLVSYSWVNDLEDPKFPPLDAQPYEEDGIVRREKSVERQLDKLTKGLLEVVEKKLNIRSLMRSVSTYESLGWKVVQFLHRTFREFLQEKLRQNGFLQKFPGSTLGEIYGKIRLADVSYRCPPHMVQDIGLRDFFVVNGMYMLSPARVQKSNELWGLPLALTEQLRLICQETRFCVGCWGMFCRNPILRQSDNASFIHLAAAAGHSEYILKHLESDPRIFNHEYGDLSLVLSALHGGHTSLASKILEKGGSMNQQISLHHQFLSPRHGQVSDTKTAPIWMITVYLALEYEFIYPDDNSWSLRAIDLWKFIQKHVMTSTDAEEGSCQITIIYKTETSETCIALTDLLLMVPGYYCSFPETSDYMNEGCWRTSKHRSLNSAEQSDFKSPEASGERISADNFNILISLKRRTRIEFELRFHSYVMSDEWCFRIY